QFLVDANRRIIREELIIKPNKGIDVYLTIDKNLSIVAYEELIKTPSRRGAFIMMDEKGEVIVMVSAPSFDANAFIQNSKIKFSYMTSNEKPLFNRAVQGLYPPGSTFKIITAIAAIENGFNIKTSVFCTGSIDIGNKNFKCWKKHEVINDVLEAFEKSCNVYFIKMGLFAGAESIINVAKKFWLGRKMGVEIYGEEIDILPLKVSYTFGDIANISIGQGMLAISPVHLAAMYLGILNNGVLYRPRVIQFTSDGSYKSIPHIINEVRYNSIDIIKQGLLRVVESGTGIGAKIQGYKVYGKTGTAQNPHGKDHAWFVGAIEINKKMYVATCIVENVGFGAEYAVPIVKKVFQELVKTYATN
ncbi:MAG: penicillin-binding transpeptidase domain-containing protein, partial [bacterium]|nr:penicillin-binding transpeptidase domain-containing protein [bacterium]